MATQDNIEQRLKVELEQIARVLAGREGIDVVSLELGYSVQGYSGKVFVKPEEIAAAEAAPIVAETPAEPVGEDVPPQIKRKGKAAAESSGDDPVG
jgi:hypothetical protein